MKLIPFLIRRTDLAISILEKSHIYSEYWDTLTLYHICPKIPTIPFHYLSMCLTPVDERQTCRPFYIDVFLYVFIF